MSPVPRPSASDPLSITRLEIARIASLAPVRSAIAWFRDEEAEFARWQQEFARIPGPPFGEAPRADWAAERFRALGLGEVHKDTAGNVLGLRRGSATSGVSISAHL